MQLNKVLKGLMLAVFVMAVASCNFQKMVNSSNKSAVVNGAVTGMGIHGKNVLLDNQVFLQMQELQSNNTVYFNLDKYDISSEFAHMLDAHANLLCMNLSYKVTVEGHTDERGTPEYSIALGERRANAVKMYLQGKGVSADQIAIVSYGKEKLDVLGHDEIACAKNRRVVLVY